MLDIFLFTLIAFFISLVLSITNYFLNKEDVKMETILSYLPGYNCGGCGFKGCHDMAYNIVNKGADPHLCRKMSAVQYQKIEEYLKGHN